jgi:ferredoxin--NADP+ reductase
MASEASSAEVRAWGDDGGHAVPFLRKIAVIGAGPSALFLVDAVLKMSPAPVSIDVFDRLPTPYGLVRYGVAPDHANIKNVITTFHKTLEDERVRFLGNVELGRDVAVEDLRRFYDAIVYAVGASKDRRLNVPGEDLPGSFSATEFVAWYSGHPDAVMQQEFDRTRAVAVIGAGNVAIDVTRILARPIEDLRKTDIPHHALESLARSAVRDIHVIGRRGPAQAKFTTAELRELGHLDGVDVIVRPADLELDDVSAATVEKSAILKRNMDVLREFAAREPAGAPRRIFLRFFESPVEIAGSSRVESILLQRNVLDEHENAVPSDRFERLEVGVVLRSVGYRGVPVPGVPFDDRKHVIPNQGGRVIDGGTIVRGQYATGWIKRGPSGVIGTNKADSIETAKALIADLPSLPPREQPDPAAVDAFLAQRGVRVVGWRDWLAIDALEIEMGMRAGRARTKVTEFGSFTGRAAV